MSGSMALQSAFLVAFKQLIPEYTVNLFRSLLKIRFKHFPAIFLLLCTLIGSLIGPFNWVTAVWVGFYTSWIYLRFYKATPTDLSTGTSAYIRGDASETFAIAYFFPEPFHQVVAIVANSVFDVLVALKVCHSFSAADVEIGNARAEARGDTFMGGADGLLGRTAGAPMPGSARAEAERRRALALKALDQRMHSSGTGHTDPYGGSGHASGGTNSNSASPAPPAVAPMIASLSNPSSLQPSSSPASQHAHESSTDQSEFPSQER